MEHPINKALIVKRDGRKIVIHSATQQLPTDGGPTKVNRNNNMSHGSMTKRDSAFPMNPSVTPAGISDATSQQYVPMSTARTAHRPREGGVHTLELKGRGHKVANLWKTSHKHYQISDSYCQGSSKQRFF
jgi:hypothetical protein